MKKVYFVRIPIAGIVSNYVAADSEKEAIEKALADSHVFGQIDTKNNWELDELNTYRYLFHGNIDYTNLSEASAEESDELDPEDLE
jgi:hypothetical protein